MSLAYAALDEPERSPRETFDATGKVNLGSIYNSPDPRAYWRTLSDLDYRVPQEAKPYFLRCMDARRERMEDSCYGTIVDLGCSYGINSLLLRFDLAIADLCHRYASPDIASLGRGHLIARDHRLEIRRDFLSFVGVDVSPQAATYATEAGLLDHVVVADLERRTFTPDEARSVADAALIISTGCFGYVTEASLTRILQPCHERPWMMHTALRMFDFAPAEEALARCGYVSNRSPRLLKQRRFSSRGEQERILDRLCSMGIDPSGFETEGWLYAHIVVSRPAAQADAASVQRIFRS